MKRYNVYKQRKEELLASGENVNQADVEALIDDCRMLASDLQCDVTRAQMSMTSDEKLIDVLNWIEELKSLIKK